MLNPVVGTANSSIVVKTMSRMIGACFAPGWWRVLDPYLAVLAGFGALVLLTAWLPMVLREAPLSLPIVCVGIGATLWSIPGLPGTALTR